MPVRVLKGTVLLTNGHAHALRILGGLKARGLFVEAIIYERSLDPRDYLGNIWPITNFGRRLPNAMARWGIGPFKIWKAKNQYSSYAKLINVSSLNSTKTEKLLLSLRPNWILLGGVGIIKANILKTASKGVLNSHPGLLPWARGTGVVGRSLERGQPVGVTCHFVDPGIDTGPIIERRLLNITGNEKSLSDLEIANDLLSARVMVETVEKFISCDKGPEVLKQTQIMPICKWLTAPERLSIDQKIRNGLALKLFEEWRPSCDENLSLRVVDEDRGNNDRTLST